MKKINLLMILSVLIISGCSTITESTNVAPLAAYAKTELEADVSVGEKIEGTASQVLFMGLIPLPGGPTKYTTGVFSGFSSPLDPAPKLKAAATYKAIESSGADIIVNPQFTVKTTSVGLFVTCTVTVTGYKGTINSIK